MVDGVVIVETCGTHHCLQHIEPMSRSDMTARAAERCGVYRLPTFRMKQAAQKRAKSKLTMDDVMDIRYGPGSLREAAARHGISKSSAWVIRSGKQWTEIGGMFSGLIAANESNQRRQA